MKTISLTQGKVAIVDDQDYEWLNQWKWTASKIRGKWYAVRSLGPRKNRKYILMHRLVHNVLPGMVCDHRNGNSLDNRNQNLRSCTQKDNVHNQSAHKDALSKYKGISCDKSSKRRKRWRARIMSDGREKSLGYFDTELEAAKAYDQKAKELFGEFAKLNF